MAAPPLVEVVVEEVVGVPLEVALDEEEGRLMPAEAMADARAALAAWASPPAVLMVLRRLTPPGPPPAAPEPGPDAPPPISLPAPTTMGCTLKQPQMFGERESNEVFYILIRYIKSYKSEVIRKIQGVIYKAIERNVDLT